MVRETIDFISQYDPEVGASIRAEYDREVRNIELIASENIVSEAVMAAMSDGRFEVILIAVPQTPLELQETLTALRTRDYERCRAIDFFHAAALRVECAADLEWTLDGEQVTGLSEAEVSVLPGAMHLACP